ncbi:MAG: hypothetical protein V3S41_07335 [Spirochaetia bacterium]
MTPLTREVVDYQRTGEGLGRLVDQISRMVYEFPVSQNGFSDEDGAELLLRFLPRITRLIGRYRESGRSFESYLGSTLRWQITTLAAERSAERIQLAALRGPGGELRIAEQTRVAAPVMEAREPGRKTSYRTGSSSRQSTRYRLSSGQGRRLIHLSLKMAERLGEADYRRVAAASGRNPEWLVGCWQTLRDGCTAQRERRRSIQERRDRAWFKSRCLQYRLRLVLEDGERDATMRQLAMWHRRYEHARRVLAKMHDGPSHAEIARVLNVPKGTVDSSVFYGKRELRNRSYLRVLASAVSNP